MNVIIKNCIHSTPVPGFGRGERQGEGAGGTVGWELFIHLVNVEEKRKQVAVSGNHAFYVIHSRKGWLCWPASSHQDVQRCERQAVKVVKSLLFVLSVFFVFSGLHPWHMEVPRLGVESELQPPAYTTATQQRRTQTAFATYTTSQGNASSLTS